VTLDPSLTARVHQLIADWCRGGGQHRRLTALTALGTSLGAGDTERTLQNLQNLALSGDGDMQKTAARSVVELFDTNPHIVLRKLADWADGDDEARRPFLLASFTRLSSLRDEAGRPALLVAQAREANGPPLVALWQQALWDRDVQAETWDNLEQWCRHVDGDPELMQPLANLIAALAALGPPLDAKLAWYLGFWATHHPDGPSATADKLRFMARRDER
jgi:hypothetical protein